MTLDLRSISFSHSHLQKEPWVENQKAWVRPGFKFSSLEEPVMSLSKS